MVDSTPGIRFPPTRLRSDETVWTNRSIGVGLMRDQLRAAHLALTFLTTLPLPHIK